jgi:6-pyruvoyltetrahydropterin/6-carboxytetrahydropterin synthase
MVIDFTDKKIVKEEIVDQFDHATVFNETTPHVELAHEKEQRSSCYFGRLPAYK